MTRAIDCLVNVDFGDREMPDWMVRVKEDYFKGGDSFFTSPELNELLDEHGRQRRGEGDPHDARSGTPRAGRSTSSRPGPTASPSPSAASTSCAR